jgi:hypothetical protein
MKPTKKRRTPKAFLLKTLVPNRTSKASTSVTRAPLSVPNGDQSGTGKASSRSSAKPTTALYLHEIDLTTDKVWRMTRKHCFKVHASEYLEVARDSKADPAIQAVFQMARYNIERIRFLRLQCLDALHQGKTNLMNSIFAKFKEEHSVLFYKRREDPILTVLFHYIQWSINEIARAISMMRHTFGFDPKCLSFCTKFKRLPFRGQWHQKDREVLNRIRDST